MKNYKERGSVTIFVLITGVFFIAVLLLINIGIMNKTTNQEKMISEIMNMYSVNENDLEQAYNMAVEGNTYPTLAEVKNLIEESKLSIYPIGSIYISIDSKDPSELFGGTWESYGEGRTLVGIGNNGETNYTEVEKEGGKENQSITLGVANIPSHTHTIPSLSGSTSSVANHTHSIPSLSGSTSTTGSHSHTPYYANHYFWSSSVNTGAIAGSNISGSGYKYVAIASTGEWGRSTTTAAAGNHSHTVTTNANTTGGAGAHSHTFSTTATNTGSTGSGTPFTVDDVQPYITVYMWKRIS